MTTIFNCRFPSAVAAAFPGIMEGTLDPLRGNEQPILLALHVLFIREHNRRARLIAAAEPALDDEQIYQRARMMVIAEIQAITFNEFLPTLLGDDAISGAEALADAVAIIFDGTQFVTVTDDAGPRTHYATRTINITGTNFWPTHEPRTHSIKR